MNTIRQVMREWTIALAVLAVPLHAGAQVTPAAAYVPPDDTPSIRVGVTLFTDYTRVQQPKIKDADGNDVSLGGFNVARAYINVTGNMSHLVAFRITPDIARETGTGSALNGSYTFRLKYAYAQFNLDDWLGKGRTGTWVRLGMQQNPWVDFIDTIYRYRFQGTTFEDREGFLSSSDVGATFHYNLPGNYGDLHAGVYNGEGYSKPEVNDQKAFMVRGSFRPLRQHPVFRGLRVTGVYDHDAYVKDAERTRAIAAVTFEHKYLNAAFDYLSATDQPRAASTSIKASGFSFWATPRSPTGWEGLIRFDSLEPTDALPGRKKRTLAGLAYWFPRQGTVSSALLFDVEQVSFDAFTVAQPTQRRVAVHALVNF